MKYTNIEGLVYNVEGLIYYYGENMEKQGGPINGYYNKTITNHINIKGEDYAEFAVGYCVKVEDLFNRGPILVEAKPEINYEIY